MAAASAGTAPTVFAGAMSQASGTVEGAAPPVGTCWRCGGTGATFDKALRASVRQCLVCGGTGQLARRRVRARSPPTAPRHADFVAPGPAPLGGFSSGDSVLADEDLCGLTGKWKIFQARAHHRYSTDDVVTAWAAARAAACGLVARAATPRILDLGTGIGSVLLMTLWLLPAVAAGLGLEAQAARAAQARRSIAYNLGAASHVAVVEGDLRDVAAASAVKSDSGAASSCSASSSVGGGPLAGEAPFDLITGTPPYFTLSVRDGAAPALPTASEQSSRCLFLYRGGLDEYAAAASRVLAPGGAVVLVDSAQNVARGYTAARAAGLRVVARLDVISRAPASGEQARPLICVFIMRREGDDGPTPPADLFVPRGRSPYEGDSVVVGESAAAQQPEAGKCVPPPAAALEPAPAAKRRQGRAQIGHAPFPGSLDGEVVAAITVRGADGLRTPEYRALLRDLGKPGDG